MTEGNLSTNTELVLLLGRMDGKMDTIVNAQRDHDRRITALEKARWTSVGVTTTIASLVSFGVTLAAAWPFK